MANIGFVGLGHMGLPMAINLIKSGHNVMGYDLVKSACTSLASAGGTIAASLDNIAKNNDIIVTMLQTGEQVKGVCFDADGLFAHAKQGTHFIDCSSIDVTSSCEFHQQATDKGFVPLDAPVSGGVAGAEAGTLTFMVGGEEQAFLEAKSLLESMGKTIIHTGGAGSGQAAKICNNMILGISMIAVSEAFVLGDKLGLRPDKLHEVVTNASGQCWAMSKYAPVPNVLENVPANRGYEPGFTAAMMLKDLKLSQVSAVQAGIKTPMGQEAMNLYQTLNDAGLSELDFSSIIKLLDNPK
jgi:3-hydroxyisobutyrate dehydrogenase